MALTESGKTRWMMNGEKMVDEILNKKRRRRKNRISGGGANVIEVKREKKPSAV